MKKKWFLLLSSLFLAVLGGCSSTSSTADQPDQFTIYTTVYPVQFIIEELSEKSSLEAMSVYPPGTDAHTYEPTSKEMAEIAEADAFFYFGGGMEVFSETAAAALADEDVELVELGQTESLFMEAETQEEEHAEAGHEEEHADEESHEGHNHGDHDPHIWLDPVRMMELTTIIEEKLIAMLPEEKEDISSEADALRTELESLHEDFKTLVETSPRKEILVSHAAYGYWEQRYGIEQHAVSGINSSDEPSQQELIKIIEEARAEEMEYIIFEQNISSSVSEKIQQEIGAEALVFHNLAVLTEADKENGEDYFSLMAQNLEALETALSK